MTIYEVWTADQCESIYFQNLTDAENYLMRLYIDKVGFDQNPTFAQDIQAILEGHDLECFGCIVEIAVR